MRLLVESDKLYLALDDLEQRNQLIHHLDEIDSSQNEAFYKWVLAFLLGLNHILQRLEHSDVIINTRNTEDTLLVVLLRAYYCSISLDQSISSIANQSSLALGLLKAYREIFFDFYNENYLLISEDPTRFLEHIKCLIESIPIDAALDVDANYLIEKTKGKCLRDLSAPTNQFYQSWFDANQNTSSMMKYLSFSQFKIQVQKLLTFNQERINFYFTSLYFKEYQIQKIFVPADDGIIIDGLQVKLNHVTSNTMVLALVGHFATESHYISGHVTKYRNLFGNDIVFINHRNYASRSAKQADSLERLADDVVCMAKYYQNKYRHIALYGMCGGSAHIIMAAQRLMRLHIPFKMIIDRFPQKYTHFVDSKTLLRSCKYNKMELFPGRFQGWANSPYFVPTFKMLHFLAYHLAKGALMLADSNKDFGKIIQELPSEDVLVLQAKSKKQVKPMCIDVVVHPDNDMREAFKDKRKVNKNILKRLRSHCELIRVCFINKVMRKTFGELAYIFTECLALIDDEKLTYEDHSGERDIHSIHLYRLSTRHQVSLTNFIGGFFKQQHTSWRALLDAFKPIQLDKILRCFETCKHEYHTLYDHDLANELQLFLQTLADHGNYIYHITNRLSATVGVSICPPLHRLLQTELFQELYPTPNQASLVQMNK